MKKYYFLTLFFLLKSLSVFSQNIYTLKDKPSQRIDNFEMLIDKEYTFKQILNDSTLEFQENPKYYKFETEEYCWFRFSIKNNSAYMKEGYLALTPEIDNILYYYDYENEKWETIQLGFAITNFERMKVFFSIYLKPKSINTFYVKSKVKELNQQEYPVLLNVLYFNKSVMESREQFIVVSWLIVLCVMTLFFVYNLYIYIIFRDVTYLFYLLIVLGSTLYITAADDIFNFIIPFSFYNIQIQPNGFLYSYSINQILVVLSIWLILFGYIQFVRNYLKLSIYLPFWNIVLKYTLYAISIFNLFFIVAISFKSSSYIYHPLTLTNNVLVALVILFILFVSILSYRKGYKIARYFLVVNIIPLLCIIVVAVLAFIYEHNMPNLLLPHIALTLQTVGFAIALVARINLLKDELKEKQLQAKDLQQENDRMLARNRYIELENEQIISEMVSAVNKTMDLQKKIEAEENQKTELQEQIETEIKQKADLQAKLEANQRELTANSLYLYQKNEMLSSLQKQIEGLSYKETTTQNREGLREIKSTIKNDIQLENDWDSFKVHFEEVHPNFFTELNEKYPTLTKYEIRLSAYYHLNMTAKEIATLLNINPSSVHRAKSRLNRKMEAIEKKNQ